MHCPSFSGREDEAVEWRGQKRTGAESRASIVGGMRGARRVRAPATTLPTIGGGRDTRPWATGTSLA